LHNTIFYQKYGAINIFMQKEQQFDIVFCSLPFLSLDRIYSAPPLLSGIVQSAGYKSRCFDFSIDFFEMCDRDIERYGYLSNYELFNEEDLTVDDLNLINKFVDFVVEKLQNCDTEFVGFSVFSRQTQKLVTKILYELKMAGFDKNKIVLGGRGLPEYVQNNVKTFLKVNVKHDKKFHLLLEELNLADNFIIGDGEQAILNFLKNKSKNKEHNFLKKLENYDYDYTNYDFERYVFPNGIISLDVTGSKGCVRACDFCNVENEFGKFIYKNGQDLAKEMIKLQKLYNINKFMLTDSLSNGGLKVFYDFLTTLSEHNKTSTIPIIWTGQYICRDEMRNNSNFSNYYDLLKESGAEGLTIGAESGSNNVLKKMLKKTTNEALFFELDQFRKRGITCNILTFIGHWSETHEDFIDHCKMIVDLLPYVKSGTVSGLSLGVIFKLDSKAFNKKNIIKSDKNSSDIWISLENTGNTYKIRCQRRLIVSKLLKKLNLIGVSSAETKFLQQSFVIAKNYKEMINDFYSEHKNIINDDYSDISDIDSFLNSIIENKDMLDINLSFSTSSCNGDPEFIVKVNDKILLSDFFPEGNYNFNFSIAKQDLKDLNSLVFQMNNKNKNDTEVDEVGNIVKDKFIKLTNLTIDRCDVLNDINFFYKNFYIFKNNEKTMPSTGMWSNDPLIVDFEKSFITWYGNTSQTNITNDSSEINSKQNKSIFSLDDLYNELQFAVTELEV